MEMYGIYVISCVILEQFTPINAPAIRNTLISATEAVVIKENFNVTAIFITCNTYTHS
jgi:hypothetical protein